MVFRASLEKKEEKERIRAELMRAALRLGAAHGFASLGLREVAREAGIAPTSFYRHFADMEELGMAIIRELAGSSLRGWGERLGDAADGGERLAALVDAMLATVARDAELARFIVAERVGAFDTFRALLRAELSQLASQLQSVFTGKGAEPVPPWAADAAVALLCDGCARALDEAKPGLPGLRLLVISALRRMLSPGERP
jgi:AcrR family transcriptional regulator